MVECFAIVGPTASGKTSIGFEIAKNYPVELISMDSMALFKDVPIMTAQPSEDEMMVQPYQLMGILEVEEEFSVSQWTKRANELINKAISENKVPVIVGGTFLYLQALLQGIHILPEGDEHLRANYQRVFNEKGASYLWDRLSKVDEISASKLHPNDFKRVSRALEVYELTGTPYSKHKEKKIKGREAHLVAVDWPREILYERINQRVDHMLDEGLIGEIRGLGERQFSRTFRQCVGFREVRRFLEGHVTEDEMKDQICKRTRHLAKHQITWMKRFNIIFFLKPEIFFKSILEEFDKYYQRCDRS